MKLEIKYLLPYMPHRLYFLKTIKAYYGGTEDPRHGKAGELAYVWKKRGHLISISNYEQRIKTAVGTFSAGNQFKEVKMRFITHHISYLPILKRVYPSIPIGQFQYDDIDYLASMHYDLFELINEGLAIDINDMRAMYEK